MLLVYIFIHIYLFIFLKNKENKESFDSPFDNIQLLKIKTPLKKSINEISSKINCCYKNKTYHSKMKMELDSVFNQILD